MPEELRVSLFQVFDNGLPDATPRFVLREFSDLKFEIGSSANPVADENGFVLSPCLLYKLFPPRGPLSKSACADRANGLLSLGLC